MSNQPLYTDVSELLIDATQTFLTAAGTAGTGTLTVSNIGGFAVNQILLIGEFGVEKSEIIKTHAVTAPSGTTITLASNLVYDHPRHTRVYKLLYDQYEIWHADTETGTKAQIGSAININADQNQNRYDDTTYTSGFYFTRYKNSISTTYSDYSDPIPYEGFDYNTVGQAIEFALRQLDTDFGPKITHTLALDEVNACLRFARGKLKKWAKQEEFDYSLGVTSRGVYSWTLPSNVVDLNSIKSILAVRIGTSTKNLIYKDKREWNEMLASVVQTTVRVAANAGDTSLQIVNSYDLDSSGTVHINGNAITYTGVTRSQTSGVLTGIPASGTGAITETLAVGTNVWQNDTEGEPYWFTIYEGKLYIWFLCDASWINKNVWLDYWKKETEVDSDSDTLDTERYDMVKHWLIWKFRAVLEENGKPDPEDSDYKIFSAILGDAIKKEISGQKYKRKIKINSITYPGRGQDFKKS